MPRLAERRTRRDMRPAQAALRKFGGRTDPLRFERRSEEREDAEGWLLATYSSDDRIGVTRLELVDRSAGGMGAISRVAIEPGMVVTICPKGSTIPWLSGRAVRCECEGDTWRVGMVFDRRRAA